MLKLNIISTIFKVIWSTQISESHLIKDRFYESDLYKCIHLLINSGKNNSVLLSQPINSPEYNSSYAVSEKRTFADTEQIKIDSLKGAERQSKNSFLKIFSEKKFRK